MPATETTPRLDENIDRREVPALKYHPKVLGNGGDALFAAGVADMDFKAPPAVLTALQSRLDHGVFGYEAVPDELLTALLNWLDSRHGWPVETGHVLRAPNVLNALAVAASLFSNDGDGVIVQPPVFFDFFDILRENKRTLVSNPLRLVDGRYCMDFDDLEKKAAAPRTRLMFLCNPHNPVGRVWTAGELQTVGEICARHDVLVVADEIHGDITFPGHSYTPFATLGSDFAANCIACISPAKTFNIASCCCAFTIIADDEKRAAFKTENSRLTMNKNNAFANVAMQAAYREGAEWLDEVLAYLDRSLDLVRDSLSNIAEVQVIEPEGTFLLWFDFRALALSPAELTRFLRENAKWAVTQGHAFGEQGNGFARVNIACTRNKLEAALGNLSLALSK